MNNQIIINNQTNAAEPQDVMILHSVRLNQMFSITAKRLVTKYQVQSLTCQHLAVNDIERLECKIKFCISSHKVRISVGFTSEVIFESCTVQSVCCFL